MEGFDGGGCGTSSKASDSGMLGRSEDTRCLDCPVMEPFFTEWTDEKHSLYIKTMEASFVDQLYSSMNMIRSCSHKPNLFDLEATRTTQSNSCSFGKKINHCKAKNLSKKRAIPIESASTLKPLEEFHSNFCNEDMIGNFTEVSDQNFVNETLEEDKANVHSLKMKALAAESSGQCQVEDLC